MMYVAPRKWLSGSAAAFCGQRATKLRHANNADALSAVEKRGCFILLAPLLPIVEKCFPTEG
jgi:hypothetical protein